RIAQAPARSPLSSDERHFPRDPGVVKRRWGQPGIRWLNSTRTKVDKTLRRAPPSLVTVSAGRRHPLRDISGLSFEGVPFCATPGEASSGRKTWVYRGVDRERESEGIVIHGKPGNADGADLEGGGG